MRPRVDVWILGIALTLAYADALATADEPSNPIELRVEPSRIELSGRAAMHGLIVSAIGRDGRTIDVTRASVFASDHPEIVAVTKRGECVAVGAGEAEVRVSFEGTTASVPVSVQLAETVAAPSFVNEVEPLFTRFGCNQGACHGKLAGQNGFRLSLRAYAPEQDHEWITREYSGRRLNRQNPDRSLLLEKPLGRVPHAGGMIFSETSRAATLLSDWIRLGAPGPIKDEPVARKLIVLPNKRTMKPGETQHLLVIAEDDQGRRRDVTWLTKFESNDAGMATVEPNGLVTVQRPGETAVRASFEGIVEIAAITSPYPNSVDPKRFDVKNNAIDDRVFAKLEALRIEPSDLSSDAEFLRRAFLDTIGALPTPEEVRSFLNDADPAKRSKWIEGLLERPEFVDLWTQQLADLFQNRKERDHDVRGVKGVRAFQSWLRAQVAANRPWNELARDVLTASGSSTENPAVGYFIVNVGEHGDGDRSEVVSASAQALLGTRIGCAQCHNHPLERYTQDDYYRFAAFFSRIRLERKDPKDGPTFLRVSTHDPNRNKEPVGVTQPRTGRFLPPKPLDRAEMSIKPGDDPRVALADWITDPKNDAFAGAMVNRLWKHYLGVGLVEPVDDLRAGNPPTNPELWTLLIQEFKSHHYDMKHVMRLILNSRTYQLSARSRPANATDARFYSHYYARRLPAEALLDAVGQATGIPESFAGYPRGMPARRLPDPSSQSYFLSLFGRPERVTACACERNDEITLTQLLHLENGEDIVKKVRDADGRLERALAAKLGDEAIADELFLATLSRFPTAPERAATAKSLAESPNERAEVFRDLFWALLNSKEFSFNH